MKLLLLAAVAATLSASVAPAMAIAPTATTAAATQAGSPSEIARRSGRCPGGERRFYVVGCGGV
jgi:hypothetical protein